MEGYPCGSSDKLGLPRCLAEEVGDHNSENSNVTDSLEPDYHVRNTKNNNKWKRKKWRINRFHLLKAVMKEHFEAVHISKKKKKRRKKLAQNCLLNYTVKRREKGHLDRKQYEHRQESNPCPLVETPGEILSETVSVSGIIKKYFSGYDEVTSTPEVKFAAATQNPPLEQLKVKSECNCSNIQIVSMPQYAPQTPPTMIPFSLHTLPSSRTTRDECKRTGVGKRLVVASNNLRISASKRKPTISLCRLRDRKLSVLKSSSLVRSLVFEIGDEEE